MGLGQSVRRVKHSIPQSSTSELLLSNGVESPARQMFLEKKYYMAPLLDNSCPILEQPSTVVEAICSFLSLKDLSSLSQTCKLFSSMVGEFLRHSSSKLSSSLDSFVTKNAALLTQFEKQLTDNLQSQLDLSINIDKDLSRQAMYKMMVNMEHYIKQVDRVSVLQATVATCTARIKERVAVGRDDKLGRDVVRVEVNQLQVGHTWREVRPGLYRVSVRMKIGYNFKLAWPRRGEDMTHWTVRQPGGDMVVIVSREWWNMIKNKKKPGRELGQGLGVEWEEVKGEQTGWLRVDLPEVVVEKVGNVSFELKDKEYSWCEKELFFDFIEIRKCG
eukprot:GFUD01034219.1.p1 GENE.GFUD01034219.1~~GFUD01034219.1.p1  ORF type:complete len:331 (+),score=110.68 GFUD01034219.1:362-1354(+)